MAQFFDGCRMWGLACLFLGGLAVPLPGWAGAAEQALITHYYQSLLRRAPDAAGLAFWDGEATRLRNAGQDPREAFLAMATQFVDSTEYRAFNRSNAEFLTDLYQAFFRRVPDTAGINYWQGQMTQGLPRGVLLAEFLFSVEFNQYITSQLGSVSTRPEGTTVIDFYRGYLFRLPDDAGLGYWQGQFRAAQCSGGTALASAAESISSLFQASSEYGARNRGNADFAGDLYSSFLRRGGDLAGVLFWIGQLNAGVTRDALRRSFLASPEFQARLAAISAAGCFSPALTAQQSARLLQQASWGASLEEINRVAAVGAEAWLNEQFALAPASHTTQAEAYIAANRTGANGCTNPTDGCPGNVNRPVFYLQALEGHDQLRQRVVNALLQIMVISIADNRLREAGTAMPSYLDMLGRHAFGNFRDLLRDVTLHPAMGTYLDMLGSSQEVPNENYARELLQLFSIGTVMLNADGTPQLDSQGRRIDTYDEDTVKGFSKAFTGWHHADQDMTLGGRFYWPIPRWTVPMKVWTARRCPQDGRWPAGSTTFCSLSDPNRSFPPPHDTGTKRLLQYAGAPYANLPAGQSAEQDIENAVDNIFNHPNVGPFIGKQLIQRLVASNPSPGYVQRVAAAFANDGSGVRGDMKAVVRAILLDAEARGATAAAGNSFGKAREPVHKFLHLHRAFGARASSAYYDTFDLSDPSQLNQSPLQAPSVFNFYDKDFAPGGPVGQAGLVAPELELATAAALTGFAEFSAFSIIGGNGQNGADTTRWWRPNYDRYLTGTSPLADQPQALVDEFDLLLTAGNLKAQFKADLVATLNGVTRARIDDQRRDRLRITLWQVLHSSEYAVQR